MTKIKTTKRLVLALIRDNLINNKLVNSLNEIGLNADDYFLHLSDTIFELVGIDDSKSNAFIFETYLDLTEKAKYINISNGHNSLDCLSEEFYLYRVNEKSKLKYFCVTTCV